MKKLIILLCAAALVTLGAGSALALTDTATHDLTISVSEVAMLDLDDTGELTFSIGAPATAGGSFTVTGTTGSATRFLMYTSIVESGLTRTITGEVDAALPTGIVVSVAATDVASGNECGDVGTAADIDLSTTAATVVSGIGSGYTGSAAGDGIQLDYSVDAIDCADAGGILFADTTVTVTYTLTEDV